MAAGALLIRRKPWEMKTSWQNSMSSEQGHVLGHEGQGREVLIGPAEAGTTLGTRCRTMGQNAGHQGQAAVGQFRPRAQLIDPLPS